MYDAKAEANEFVGDDREEAVAKACRFFGTEESELKLVSPEAGEVFGSGARAIVVAVPKNAKPIPRSDSGERGERSERGGRGDRGDRQGSDRGRDRDRGRGRDRNRGRGGQDRDREREVVSAVREEPKGESKGTPQGDVGEVGKPYG